MSEHTDGVGRPIKAGDSVHFRGEVYTIKGFSTRASDNGLLVHFEEECHTEEQATEISVDLVRT